MGSAARSDRTFGASRWLGVALILLAPLAQAAVPEAAPAPADAQMRQSIAQMKNIPRGPFEHVRWFCKDGSVLEPRPGACKAHGGGVQHGQWSATTQRIRAAGYPIANLLVDLQPAKVVGPGADAELLEILVIERFLIAYDGGWILRQARNYRGAIDDDNERSGARALLLALLADAQVPYLKVREAARLMPHGAITETLTRMRGLAAEMETRDQGFAPLRARLHNAPDVADAARVRAYANAQPRSPELRAAYAQLAASIDGVFAPRPMADSLRALAARSKNRDRAQELAALGQAFAAPEPQARLRAAATTLAWLRDHGSELGSAELRLAALDLSLDAEAVFLAATPALLASVAQLSRAQRLQGLSAGADALYGSGLIDPRERDALRATLGTDDKNIPLDQYRDRLEYLERAAMWSERRLAYHFGNGIARLARIEPLAALYVADRLRGSPLLLYSAVLQTLRDDAGELAQAQHQVFGKPAAGTLRRLNPGLARGVLSSVGAQAPAGGPAIYLVPDTAADLPPAAGILTEREGNSLSHVQLLARNLGIPNVVASREVIETLDAHRGHRLVLAASHGGLVRIEKDGPQWDAIFGREAAQSVRIPVDLSKLDLRRTDFIPTAKLSASDSGRIVGPKAAHVGELQRRFPDQVSPGLAVPFGIYREVLSEPRLPGGGQSMFEWMRAQYADIAVRRSLDPRGQAAQLEAFLSTVRTWFSARELRPEQRARLDEAMLSSFGLPGTYGVFVRSDTNVEDLPGFTGAGLNRTVFNVVGTDKVIAAIKEVWASPFTARAYGWRQGLMDAPEHVYVSVLLHRSVNNEKSGVLVTADVDTGDTDVLTIAVNAGVGGGVDGQAAETLQVSTKNGRVRLLASATARDQGVLDARGGVRRVRAAAPQELLSREEIESLVKFSQQLPERYPELRDGDGKPAPADAEFGFFAGRLVLFQIRPFLRNRAAQQSKYLAELDAGLKRTDDKEVDLSKLPPEQAS